MYNILTYTLGQLLNNSIGVLFCAGLASEITSDSLSLCDSLQSSRSANDTDP